MPLVSPAISVFGFCPIGRAGNISSFAFAPIVGGGLEDGRLFAGLALANDDDDDEVVGIEVQAALFWPLEREDAPPRAGKGLDFEELLLVLPRALPQLP